MEEVEKENQILLPWKKMDQWEKVISTFSISFSTFFLPLETEKRNLSAK